MALGTRWVAPGEGATVEKLWAAFDVTPADVDPWTTLACDSHLDYRRFCNAHAGCDPARRTNLRLTGEALCRYDYQRLGCAAVDTTPGGPVLSPGMRRHLRAIGLADDLKALRAA